MNIFEPSMVEQDMSKPEPGVKAEHVDSDVNE